VPCQAVDDWEETVAVIGAVIDRLDAARG
jgi:hypothetical protein